MEKIELTKKIKFINDNKHYKSFFYSITNVPKGYGQENDEYFGICEGDGNYRGGMGEGEGLDEEQGIDAYGTGEGDGNGDGSGWQDYSGEG